MVQGDEYVQPTWNEVKKPPLVRTTKQEDPQQCWSMTEQRGEEEQ
jgi:hypothetical protein